MIDEVLHMRNPVKELNRLASDVSPSEEAKEAALTHRFPVD